MATKREGSMSPELAHCPPTRQMHAFEMLEYIALIAGELAVLADGVAATKTGMALRAAQKEALGDIAASRLHQ